MKLEVQNIYNGQKQENQKQECNYVQQLMSAKELRTIPWNSNCRDNFMT